MRELRHLILISLTTSWTGLELIICNESCVTSLRGYFVLSPKRTVLAFVSTFKFSKILRDAFAKALLRVCKKEHLVLICALQSDWRL